MVVENRSGKVWVREARLYAEERAELVQKMGEAPLVYGSLRFAGLDSCGVRKAGRRWRRRGTA